MRYSAASITDERNMSFTAVSSLGLGLSMDAFAASLGQGAATDAQKRMHHALLLGLAFGVAQGVMPLVGWSLGVVFQDAFRNIDHWVAFGLLAMIGITMIRASLSEDDEAQPLATRWKLLALAVATSVDAAAAGVTLTLMGVPVLVSCLIIGVITCSLTMVGTLLGSTVGARMGKTAEIFGGLILIAIGGKILFEHLFLGVS